MPAGIGGKAGILADLPIDPLPDLDQGRQNTDRDDFQLARDDVRPVNILFSLREAHVVGNERGGVCILQQKADPLLEA